MKMRLIGWNVKMVFKTALFRYLKLWKEPMKKSMTLSHIEGGRRFYLQTVVSNQKNCPNIDNKRLKTTKNVYKITV